MLRCSPVLGSFHVLQPGGVKFLEGTHFYHDPGGGLIFFAYGQGGQEIFLPSRSSPR